MSPKSVNRQDKKKKCVNTQVKENEYIIKGLKRLDEF